MPETKGRTLEEIEEAFNGKRGAARGHVEDGQEKAVTEHVEGKEHLDGKE
jgi:hypothetical protein